MKHNSIMSEGAYQWAYSQFVKHYGREFVENAIDNPRRRLSIDQIVQQADLNAGNDIKIFLFESRKEGYPPIVMGEFPEEKITMYFLNQKEYKKQKEKEYKEIFTLLLMFGRCEYTENLYAGKAKMPTLIV